MVLYLAGLVTHVWLVHLTSCEHIDSDKGIATLSTLQYCTSKRFSDLFLLILLSMW